MSAMLVCIHRGACEIGGTCVEVTYGGARLLLDLGLPLDAGAAGADELPAIPGLVDGDASLLGIVVSHAHPDHYGLVGRAHPSVPVYVGAAARRILRDAAFFARTGIELAGGGELRDRVPLQIGPFTVTPYLVDHSAFDAYAILVEAGGRRLLYSGDLRFHGRKHGMMERLLAEPPDDVDALLLEGTSVGPAATPGSLGETELEHRCAEVFRATPGLGLAAFSVQDIDRLVTLFRAARRSGRLFVMDLYSATMARATGCRTIPQAEWEHVRVFVPLSQRIKVKQAREFDRVAWLRERRIYPEELASSAGDAVLTFRGSMRRELERADCLAGANLVWSMWPGYLDRPSGAQLRSWCSARGIPLTVLHSSGHATVADLERLARAVSAKQVIPVRTRHPDSYDEWFDAVCVRADGERWAV